jgi:hypothetical protein
MKRKEGKPYYWIVIRGDREKEWEEGRKNPIRFVISSTRGCLW